MKWRVVRAGFETVREMFWREKGVLCSAGNSYAC